MTDRCYLSDEVLHKNRIEKEPIFFDVLTRRYLGKLREWWRGYTLPDFRATNKAYLFYEMRNHPNIEFVLYNCLYFCEGFGLVVYCSRENVDRIRTVLGHNVDRAEIHVLFETDVGREEGRRVYNEFLMSLDTWTGFPAEHVLVCELDAYFLRKLPTELIDYDYVGYEWPWLPSEPGGGGISLRRRSAMVRICKESKQPPVYAQDSWAANGVKELGLTYTNAFIESRFKGNAIAVHQWWSFIDYEKDANETWFKQLCVYFLTLDIPI